MNSILITGCNRGLGLGLIKAFAAKSLTESKLPKYIFATCRNVEKATELKELANKHSNIHILEMDVTDESSYDRIFNEISNIVQDNGLNVLFNNAGIATRSTRLHHITSKELLDSFKVNTIAPIMLAKTFLPLLKKAADNYHDRPIGCERAAIINMSSILASIESNDNGGMYGYRVSKSGLNAASKSISIDLKKMNIMCVAMHPGWVKTEMGGSHAPLEIDVTCKQIMETILSLKPKDNGTFIQYHGESMLPW